MRRFIVRSFIVAVVVLAGLLTWTLTKPPPPLPPLPNPNGFDDFANAGHMVADDVSEWRTMTRDNLRQMVSSNVSAVLLGRMGLKKDCRVPVVVSPGSAEGSITNAYFTPLSDIKHLGQAFTAEGRMRELEGRTNEAAAAYLDAIRLGHESCRGGVIINSLVGIAIQAIGISPLERVVPELEAKQCRELAAAIEELEVRREPVEDTKKEERRWIRQVYGLKGTALQLLEYKSLKQLEKSWVGKLQTQQTRAERLTVALAARAYELEKGHRPQSISDLVPEYLKAVPNDPVTGKSMNFRP